MEAVRVTGGDDCSMIQVNADQFSQRIEDARASLRRAKDSSSEGAAITYIVHRNYHSEKT
jgi:hypothetical protein